MEDVDENSVSELPSEIIHSEILPRLPAKSLIRFRCVCKTWSSLFRNPSFVTAHRNFQRQCPDKEMTTVLLVVWDSSRANQHLLSVQIGHQASTSNDPSQAVATNLLTLSAPSLQMVFDSYVVQHTSGLICAHHSKQKHELAYHDRVISVFNPSTRDSITIPQPYPPSGRISHHFGFCHVTNEYKILLVNQIWNETGRCPTVFKILTLAMGCSSNSGTNSWRTLEVDKDDAIPVGYYFRGRSVCVQGAMHWVGRARLRPSDDLERIIIVAFDVRYERFRSIILPSDYSSDEYFDIIELNGCVCLAFFMFSTQTLEMRILKDYKNQEWVKETVTFPVRWRNVEELLPLFDHAGGEVLPLNVSNTAKGIRVHFYNTITKNFKTCEIILPESIIVDDRAKALRAVFSYESCIVPLK